MSVIHNERLVLEQENGNPVTLVVNGDEFYARMETPDGYTVVYDVRLGLYCYAVVVDGCFKSTEIPVNKRPPVGTRKHLQESSAVRAAKFEGRFRILNQQERIVPGAGGINYTLGQNNGLLAGRRVSEGTVKGLTILVEFKDIKTNVRKQDIKNLLSKNNYKTNGNFCSVKEYFLLVSNGKLTYENVVVGPVTLAHDRRYYETHELQREALRAAINDHNVNLADFDSRGEGIVDAISFMYAGRTVYGINGDNSNPSDLWPHNSYMTFYQNGIRTRFYQLTSLGRSPADLSIGTFCHESGHMLCRFPDLYDYGRRDSDFTDSAGLGRYCLMSSGNHLDYGRTPAPVCGYLRDLVDWPNNTVYLSEPVEHEIVHGDYGILHKYLTDKPNEYFIIENRSKMNLDEHLPSSGLAVFHCDTEGSNEWQLATADRHYQCALLQADGKRDLENDRRGDADDMFADVEGVALSSETMPSSREWDGSDSGLIIRDISVPGQDIIFFTGNAPVDPDADTISKELFPDLFIPDKNPQGVKSSINLTGEGNIKAIRVTVDISHTFKGDIRLELNAPDGTNILLIESDRRPGNNLNETFGSDTHEELKKLVGAPFAGEWILHIKDLLERDTGSLTHWKIEVDYQADNKELEIEQKPALDIPDDDPLGVTDTIQIDEEGILRDIEVALDVSHTFIRDLRIELTAPSGHSIFLHNRQGGGADDIKQSYNRTNLEELDQLLGLPIKGPWSLKLKDLEGADVGTLNAWRLKLKYN